LSGTRAERYQVLLHVDAEALVLDDGGMPRPGRVAPVSSATAGESNKAETSAASDGARLGATHLHASFLPQLQSRPYAELEDGTPVSAETARRLACDLSRVDVHHSSNGSVLDVGRKTRTVPPALRRALEARDRGCRFPGCGLRFTDAHHIVHWADGGGTNLGNLVLLCRRHHRAVHEGGFRIFSDIGGRQVVFVTRTGRWLFDAADPPRLPERPLEALIKGNRARGSEPDWRSGMPGCKRDTDIPWQLEHATLNSLETHHAEDHPLEAAGHAPRPAVSPGNRSAADADTPWDERMSDDGVPRESGSGDPEEAA
jgi:hypothetical protein